jgi:hypothetical protein
MLVLLWFYLAEDWLLKYSTWKAIENISWTFDMKDGRITDSESKSYLLTCLGNFFLQFSFLLSMVVAFYLQIHKKNCYMNAFVEQTLGISFLIGWIWNVFISNRFSIGKSTKLRTIYWKYLTLRAHTLGVVRDYYIRTPKVDFPAIRSGGDAFIIICKAFRILFSFFSRWLFIYIFIGLALIIKPLIGLFLVLQIDFTIVNPNWNFNHFQFGCIYLAFQIVIDIFTVSKLNVPPHAFDGGPTKAEVGSK